ncbi:MAG TPA: GNAT family N-acetyltransferase [Trebonia sp.]|jgi:ribosomal protein S18 acetylase RimI-like enzyme|nr:GNAT family N-acetyltransferase [Trebonia sp.]
MIVREALPGEAAAVGALRVEAYDSQHLLAANSGYADTLRRHGFDGHGTVFAAVDDDGKLLGTVMLDPWNPESEVARGADETEVRMLAVAPAAQGQGVGRALMLAVIDAATVSGARTLLLSTRPVMKAAQHIYQSMGFIRSPELDWSPLPDVPLIGYRLPLAPPRRRRAPTYRG